jgi:hypothetical protein
MLGGLQPADSIYTTIFTIYKLQVIFLGSNTSQRNTNTNVWQPKHSGAKQNIDSIIYIFFAIYKGS